MSLLRSVVGGGAALLLGSLLFVLVAPEAVAADRGEIRGRVVDGETGEPRAGVRVMLTGANEDGSERIQETITTDQEGRYRFTGLGTDEQRAYAIDAEFQGGLFAGRPIRFPEGVVKRPVIESTLRVWGTTTDPASIIITRDDMFAVLGEEGIAMIEAVTVVNQTQRAYIGRGGGSTTEPSPSIGFALPVDCRQAGVTIVDADIDIPQLVCTDFGFGITTAIPPGEFRTTFSYRIPGDTSTFDLSRTALYDISSVSVFAADPLSIESNGLEAKGEVSLAGKKYRRWSSRQPASPGDAIQVVAIAEAGLTPGLIGGIVASVLLLGGVAFLSFRRARRPRAPEDPPEPSTDAVGEIARLDLAYKNGEMSRQEWVARRKDLKHRLGEER
ncbi:MAG TPA: carboxypeptidase-like regulatory domain-containing protein [Actinomycetota bacterium]|nr:carboxypeptidase-like regulatory domain-containing protein [Actinomycetota bacterium]